MNSQDRLPSLAVLRCFEAAAKYQSYTAAAEVLGLTQSAVSRQVKELEDHIGTNLFYREGRGVRLTVAGDALMKEISGDLNRLRHTIHHAIIAGSGPKALAIAAPPTFAARWLVSRLPSFQAQHPGMQLAVYSRAEPFDLTANKIDVAVHFGGWDWPGAQLTPLCPENLVVVAAPSLLAQHAASTSADILQMPLLHLSARPHLWPQFAATQVGSKISRHGCSFDQFSLLIEAAVAGMGAAILPSYLIESELARNGLAKLASINSDTGQSYFIATPMGPAAPIVSAFVAWLRNQVVRRT
ncbi:LysR substrate-binding domain-containing protein [Sulfitobacter sp. W074]|uniref:LysR substrate-binding domain-containing protein n=1 Tax=Sulfitobacter sp. W074 TaxID=2867026 RepID=UPI0021A422E9|nr:LysR substrate-binding domain-containing protein [Sulfitobacter sp. W074]UWR38431.1 LysR family transcriptional regulator [Sulfitobacter sp. W074]